MNPKKAQIDAETYYSWSAQEAVVVYDLHKHPAFRDEIWSNEYFARHFSEERSILVDCRANEQLSKGPLREFWDGFTDYSARFDDDELPNIYKLKDWPTSEDICRRMPRHYEAFRSILPCHEISVRNGALNLAKYLPQYFCIPDLGPKMYIAYGWLEEFIETPRHEIFQKMRQGSTDAHVDISGAVNLMMNVVEPKISTSIFSLSQREEALQKLLEEGGMPSDEVELFIKSKIAPGALWHMWAPRDTPKIRKLLKDTDKKQYRAGTGNDPIHDQDTYITKDLRMMLEKHGIRGKYIIQCKGDAVYIPSGAIHQVLNINSCIKIACDFISPQCVRQSLQTTDDLRKLSTTHVNREDKLQLKAHLFHSAKEIINSIIWEPFFKYEFDQKPITATEDSSPRAIKPEPED